MSEITLLGLGPGAANALTLEAFQLLQSASNIFVRTRVHPTVATLPESLAITSFDHLYEQASNFEEIYTTIAQQILAQAKQGLPVIYAVPGHPLVAEASCRYIIEQAQHAAIPIRVIHGLSFIEPVCSALRIDPLATGIQLLDALELLPKPALAATGADRAWCELNDLATYEPAIPFPVVPQQALLLCQVYNRPTAADVKLSLLERYPADHEVTIVQYAGMPEEVLKRVPLAELDHHDIFNHLTCVFVPVLSQIADLRSFETLTWIMQKLTGPHGCPWDREQTHETLRKYMLEEMYEALDALDSGDWHAFADELGDVLLQIVFHAEFGRQASNFVIGDVLEAINAKMMRRHPHIFADVTVTDADEVLRNWNAIKATEKPSPAPVGILNSIPSALPALATAQTIGTKVAKLGFDWPNLDGVWDKIAEELTELREASAEERFEELGDVLFSVTNLARWLEIDAEAALRRTINKFKWRFQFLEQAAAEQSKSVLDFSLDEANVLWEQAKKLEKKR